MSVSARTLVPIGAVALLLSAAVGGGAGYLAGSTTSSHGEQYTGVASPDARPGDPGDPGVDGRHGIDGNDGVDGVNGLDGRDGADGRDGTNGRDGADGTDGETGPQGPTGATGAQGPAGAAGPQGEPGAIGPEGPTGPEGAAGPPGVISYAYFSAEPFTTLRNGSKFVVFEREAGNLDLSLPGPQEIVFRESGIYRISVAADISGVSGEPDGRVRILFHGSLSYASSYVPSQAGASYSISGDTFFSANVGDTLQVTVGAEGIATNVRNIRVLVEYFGD